MSVCDAERSRHAPEGIAKQRRGRALPRRAADLLVVKHAEDGDAGGRLTCEEAFEGSEHAGQIVELRARNIFLLRAENRARLTDVEG